MQTLTIQINNDKALKALKDLEQKHAIRIIDSIDLDVPSIKGSPLSVSAFRNWVKDAETTPAISLSEAKEKWTSRKNRLYIVQGDRPR